MVFTIIRRLVCWPVNALENEQLEPENQLFQKGETSEPNLHDFGFQPFVFGGVRVGLFTFFFDWLSLQIPLPQFTYINIYIHNYLYEKYLYIHIYRHAHEMPLDVSQIPIWKHFFLNIDGKPAPIFGDFFCGCW